MYVALRVHKTTIKSHIVANVNSGPVQINVINLDSGSMRIILNMRLGEGKHTGISSRQHPQPFEELHQHFRRRRW